MKIDDDITEIIVNTDIFRNIHPNVITIFGMILNVVLLHANVANNHIYFGVVLIIRWLCDCLDGAVARKYNKTSKVGNILDTISDIMLQFFLVYILLTRYYDIGSKWIVLGFIIYTVFMICKYNVLNNHEEIKKYGKNNFLNKIIVFGTNNSLFLFLLAYFLWTRKCDTCPLTISQSITKLTTLYA